MEKNPKQIAQNILSAIGGKENVQAFEHCATRLRIIVKDKELIDEDAIEAIEGVSGQFFSSGQYQIILGTGLVNKVHAQFSGLLDGQAMDDVKEAAYANMNIWQKISRTLGDIFLPIIPVLVATGLFMGLRGLILSFDVEVNPQFLVFTEVLTDTAFAFLPALIAWSTVHRFGGSPVIGLVLGLMLVAPQLPNAYAVGSGEADPIIFSILGLKLPVMGYQGSVIPALFVGIIAAKIEQWLRTKVPNILDLILTPFLTLLLSISLGLFIVGPIMYKVELAVLAAFMKFLSLPLGLGGLLIGGLNQIVVVSGVHHVLNTLEVNLLAELGQNPYNAIITGAMAAQGAATLAVALKVQDPKKKSLYYSSAMPAFLGISEPAIFGVNLRYIKPFVFALAGGAASGMFASLMGLAGNGMGITVIPGTLLYVGNNLGLYLLTNLIAMAVSFGLTYSFFDPNEI